MLCASLPLLLHLHQESAAFAAGIGLLPKRTRPAPVPSRRVPAPDAMAAWKAIDMATSSEEFLDLVDVYLENLDYFATLKVVLKLSWRNNEVEFPVTPQMATSEVVLNLLQRMVNLLEVQKDLRATDIRALVAAAKSLQLSGVSSAADLVTAARKVSLGQLKWMGPNDIISLLQTTPPDETELISAAADRCRQLVRKMGPPTLTELTALFAGFKHKNNQYLKLACEVAIDRLKLFKKEQLLRFISSLAQLDYRSSAFLKKTADLLAQDVGILEPQELVLVMSAFVKANFKDVYLQDCLARAVEWRSEKLSTAELVTMLQGFASLQSKPQQLLEELQKKLPARAKDMTAEERAAIKEVYESYKVQAPSGF